MQTEEQKMKIAEMSKEILVALINVKYINDKSLIVDYFNTIYEAIKNKAT
ncbi:MAG: hypothetical protein WC645_00605 [Candidatus Margulisiibacteriota bacterium]